MDEMPAPGSQESKELPDESNARADQRQKGHRNEPPVGQITGGSGRAEGRDVPPSNSDHDPDSPWLGGG